MPLTKLVDGVVVPMTTEEEAAWLAARDARVDHRDQAGAIQFLLRLDHALERGGEAGEVPGVQPEP